MNETITIPKSHLDQMRVPAAIERAYSLLDNLYVATGKWAPGFEWVLEDGVTCCEFVHGVNVCLETATYQDELGKGTMFRFFTRRSELDIGSTNGGMFFALKESLKVHPWLKEDGSHYGVFKRRKNGFDRVIWRRNQVKRMRYDQWGKYEKTVDNVSCWLRDDLGTHFFEKDYGTARDSGLNRPAGLLFVHPDGRNARVTCDMFPWFYDGRSRTPKAPKNPYRITKEQWEEYNDAEKEGWRQVARQARIIRKKNRRP